MNDFEQIEAIFRFLNREVWIVTASEGERRGGLVATWVSQASIDTSRPVVLIGIAPNHFTAELIDASRSFALHLLISEQTDTALGFAIGSGRDRDKFAEVEVSTSQNGSPILVECHSWLDCKVFARLDGGDRIYFWADVVESQINSREQPICERELIAVASDDQRRALRTNRLKDVELHRPLIDEWREDLPENLRPQK